MVGPPLASTWDFAASNLEAFFARYGHLLLGPGEWALHLATGLAGSVAVIFAAVIVSGFLYAPAPHLLAAIRVARQAPDRRPRRATSSSSPEPPSAPWRAGWSASRSCRRC